MLRQAQEIGHTGTNCHLTGFTLKCLLCKNKPLFNETDKRLKSLGVFVYGQGCALRTSFVLVEPLLVRSL
jgi:hypothetical protein